MDTLLANLDIAKVFTIQIISMGVRFLVDHRFKYFL